MEKDEVWEEYKKRLFELKLKERNEMMQSGNRLTASEETTHQIQELKKEMRRYKLEKMEGKVR